MAVYRGAVRIAKGAKPTLFQRAVGYEYETMKTAENGEQVQHLVFVPPEVRACMFWLAGWGAVKGVGRRPGWRSSTAPERTPADIVCGGAPSDHRGVPATVRRSFGVQTTIGDRR
jgi:hypothetical protein